MTDRALHEAEPRTRAKDEEEVAQIYADALRQRSHAEWFWHDFNAAIIERWSITALQRIKRRAWAIAKRADR